MMGCLRNCRAARRVNDARIYELRGSNLDGVALGNQAHGRGGCDDDDVAYCGAGEVEAQNRLTRLLD